ncbi:MAG: TonB-dependent receptor [Asticcacaulis sp.]
MKVGLRGGVSHTALAVCVSLAMVTGAVAQEAPASEGGETTEVVVVGVRKALRNAQTTKRQADTVVDSISATDIGAFPDKSVAEALQRVAGVSVTRFAAKNDVMRFSAEPSGVVIRGLLQVRSEFNGRDSFSANSSYGLSWSDVSPELMGGVDVYKNVTADMIEGGIAGTVNLRTRLPFDQRGRLLAASAEANYGDLAKKTTPTFSALYSDRWDTEAGEFGFLANVTQSEITTNSQGTTLPRIMPFAAGVQSSQKTYIPSGFSINDNMYTRTRKGASLAGQWTNSDRTLLATVQYNYSSYRNKWFEDSVSSAFSWVDSAVHTQSSVWTDPTIITPADVVADNVFDYIPGAPFTFRSDGLFQTGVITTGNGWGMGSVLDGWPPPGIVEGSTDQFGHHDIHGVDLPLIQPCINAPGLHGNRPCEYGVGFVTQSRFSDETRVVEDLALNLTWTPTEKLKLNFDAQIIRATAEKYDVSLGLKTFANVNLDLTGKYPKIKLEAPNRYNLIGDMFSDPRNYSPEWIMDHATDSEGEMKAYRADVDYDLDGVWLDSVRAGLRVADREQQHRWSNYNWSNIAGIWSTNARDAYFVDSGPTYNDNGSIRFQGYEPGYYELRNIGGDILSGDIINVNAFPFITHDVISNAGELARRFAISGQTDQGGVASSTWNPICERLDEVDDSCFTGGEILDVREQTNSAYFMLKFGGPSATIFNGIGVSGNVGVRVVRNRVSSNGGMNFAKGFTAADLNCQPLSEDVIQGLPPGVLAISPPCLAINSFEDHIFSDNSYLPLSSNVDHRYTLPSFNIKFDLTEEWVLRFAASRAMSKPDIGLLRNYMQLNRATLNQSDIRLNNPNLILDENGDPFAYRYSYTASMGNPRLKAITADQVDLSLEYYFAAVGSLTMNVFHKKFNDYIQNGSYVLPVTNNGITRDVAVTLPVNSEGAKISGFEIAYQQYFDFLPAPWDGFGVQANYTRIKNSGVENQALTVDTADGSTVAGSARSGSINPGRLEGLSDHQYNLVLMYEKAKFGARLAYNWRSEYLISVNDCCIGLPVWNKAEGFLDGSVRYSVTPNIELSVQGSNLLGTKTVYTQQAQGPTADNPNTPSVFLPAGWYENDRRVLVGIRLKY